MSMSKDYASVNSVFNNAVTYRRMYQNYFGFENKQNTYKIKSIRLESRLKIDNLG